MTKNDFIINAFKSSSSPIYKLQWIISVFSLTEMDSSEFTNKLYPYKLLKNNTSYYFIDEDGKSIIIEDSDIGKPLFSLKDTITIDSTVCENTNDTIKTTLGRLLFNKICLVYAFGKKIPYQNTEVSTSKLNKIIAEKLEDNPENESDRSDKYIYVDEYLKYSNSLSFIEGLAYLCVWAMTAKTMLPPPGIDKFKKKLLSENKDKLDDPSVVTKIEDELVKYDAEYLKGDPGGEYFANSSKMRNDIRKKLFLMYGVEDTIGGDKVKPIINSLEEGLTVESFPQINDALRNAAFSRGFETQKGGELSKWLLRVTSSVNILTDDCNTTLGFRTLFTESNYKQFVKLYYMDNDKTILIDSEEKAKELIGRVIIVRSPMFCKTEGTDYCKYCTGERLAINPTAVSSFIANLGSTLLVLSLKKTHGKSLSIKYLDWNNVLT